MSLAIWNFALRYAARVPAPATAAVVAIIPMLVVVFVRSNEHVRFEHTKSIHLVFYQWFVCVCVCVGEELKIRIDLSSLFPLLCMYVMCR